MIFIIFWLLSFFWYFVVFVFIFFFDFYDFFGICIFWYLQIMGEKLSSSTVIVIVVDFTHYTIYTERTQWHYNKKKTRHYRTGHIVHWPRLGGLTAYVSHTVLVGLIVCLPIEKSERNQVFCVVQFALMMFDKTVCQRISCYGSLATTKVLHVTQVKTLWLRRVIVFAGIYVKLFQSSVL